MKLYECFFTIGIRPSQIVRLMRILLEFKPINFNCLRVVKLSVHIDLMLSIILGLSCNDTESNHVDGETYVHMAKKCTTENYVLNFER